MNFLNNSRFSKKKTSVCEISERPVEGIYKEIWKVIGEEILKIIARERTQWMIQGISKWMVNDVL